MRCLASGTLSHRDLFSGTLSHRDLSDVVRDRVTSSRNSCHKGTGKSSQGSCRRDPVTGRRRSVLSRDCFTVLVQGPCRGALSRVLVTGRVTGPCNGGLVIGTSPWELVTGALSWDLATGPHHGGLWPQGSSHRDFGKEPCHGDASHRVLLTGVLTRSPLHRFLVSGPVDGSVSRQQRPFSGTSSPALGRVNPDAALSTRGATKGVTWRGRPLEIRLWDRIRDRSRDRLQDSRRTDEGQSPSPSPGPSPGRREAVSGTVIGRRGTVSGAVSGTVD